MNESTQLRCDLSRDAAFGPIIESDCRVDFTFSFEQYILSIVPSIVFLGFAGIRANVLRKRKTQVAGVVLRTSKLIAIAIFASLQLTLMITWMMTKLPPIQGPASTASSLSFVSSLMLLGISYLEHTKSLRPSTLINAYLFLTVLFDIAIVRTLWLAFPSNAIRELFTASFALKVVILILEAKEKRDYVVTDKSLGPEETSGLYSQSLVWWLNSIIKQGYRYILKPTDLYPVDGSMSADKLNTAFWTAWNKAAVTGKPNLLLLVFKQLKWAFIFAIIPRLALLGFTFCQPLLVERLLKFLRDGDDSIHVGYGLIGAYAVVYFGMSISNSLYFYRNARFFTMLRGILVSAIYAKTTEISITALDNSAAVTLMSTDVERIVGGLEGFHDIWANILQFFLAIWLLERKMGWACVGPVVAIFGAAVLTASLSLLANKLTVAWIKKTEHRVGITSNLLGHMKGIKMLGLTEKLSTLIQGLRTTELQYAQKFWVLNSVIIPLAFSPQTLSPVATFAFYAIIAAKDGTILDAPRLFTSLALLILLTQPLFFLLNSLVHFMAIFGCIERIQSFLTTETRSDHRIKTTEGTSSRISSPTQVTRNGRSWHGPSAGIELTEYPRPNAPNVASTPVLRVEQGSFGWSETESPNLHDINITINRAQLTLLVGPIASGKSTLLKAILGETPSSKGFIYVSEPEVAYCDQTPWLTNVSVRHNIIGFSKFDQKLYDEVIHCCDLAQDIATFLHKHDTVIGSKGISLSTGQKQRIALARAVYSKKAFMILDDVFSGLDANTRQNIFVRLLGPEGALRRWKTTVLIASHSIDLIPLSDHVIALSEDGTVAEQGSVAELQVADGYVFKLLKGQIQHAVPKDVEAKASKQDESAAPQSQTSQAGLAEDDPSRQLGDWSVYKYYFRSIGPNATIIFLVFASGWAFLNAFPTVWLKWYVDANTKEPNKHTGFYLGIYSGLQGLMLLDICGLSSFSFLVMAKRSGTKLHQILVNTVMSAPMLFFSKTDMGTIITRFSQDMMLMDSILPISLMIVAGGFMGTFVQIGLIASGAYYVSICFPVLFTVYYFVQRYYLRTSRQMRFLDLEEKAPVYTQFIESLSGLATLRAFAWQKPLIEHNHVLIDKSQKPFYLMYMIQTWLSLVLDLITTALAIIVVAVSVKMRDTVSVGFTGVSLTQIISFTSNLRMSILFWTHMETSIGAVARVKKFEAETENENLGGPMQEPPADWPSKGEVRIEGLTVAYGTASNTRKALDNINLTIPAASRLLVAGRTGSGKSTFLSSFFRLHPITSGRILIDNIDTSTIPLSTLRSRLTSISEDSLFFTSTIRQNLDPYEASTDEQIEIALSKMGLSDVIKRHGGLDAEFNEDMLSHGQRQVFCLARAILRPGKVVLLDEVSSSVDVETELLIRRVLREEFGGRTVICVAHRVEGLEGFDRCVRLENGRVVKV